MATRAVFHVISMLRDALIYPLHFHSVFFILIGSFLLWLLSSSLFGIMVVVAWVTGFMHFLLHSLQCSALGETQPPIPTSDDLVRPGSTPLKLLISVIVWVSLVKQAALLFPLAGLVLTITGYLLLPAFATLLVLEDSLRYALSPVRLLRFVVRGGFAYLLLAAAFAASLYLGTKEIFDGISAEGFKHGLVMRVPQPAALAWLMGGMYIATAFAHLLGRLAGHAHDFRPPPEHTISKPAGPAADSAMMVAAELDTLLRHGQRDEVLAAWEKHSARDAAFQSALFDALVRERAWSLVPLQAQRTISSALLSNRQVEALRICMHTLNDFESFTTSTAKEWLALCETANQTGQDGWLKVLAEKAAEKFPGAGELLDVALLLARHLSARDDNFADARAALQPFLDLRDHPRHAELLRLDAALQAMEHS